MGIWDSKKHNETCSDTPTTQDGIFERFHWHQRWDDKLKPDKSFINEVTEDVFRKEISKSDGTKAIPVRYIPAGMLKSKNDIQASILTKIVNLSFRNGSFPDDLKAAVIPIVKKNDNPYACLYLC